MTNLEVKLLGLRKKLDDVASAWNFEDYTYLHAMMTANFGVGCWYWVLGDRLELRKDEVGTMLYTKDGMLTLVARLFKQQGDE